MFKRVITSLSVLSFISFGNFVAVNAADEPAIWLKVTADGVAGSSPNLNKINARGKDVKISKKKCKKNNAKTFGAIAGGIFGATRGRNTRSQIAGAATGAIVGAAAGSAIDGC
tara:strand:+ start:487 stop:825 length:339 start_codon:yes stop_codon:yes gene_type:complete